MRRRDNSKSLSTGDVARELGVSITVVLKWCNRGLLPHHRIPGSTFRRIDRADFERFVQGLEQGPAAPSTRGQYGRKAGTA